MSTLFRTLCTLILSFLFVCEKAKYLLVEVIDDGATEFRKSNGKSSDESVQYNHI